MTAVAVRNLRRVSADTRLVLTAQGLRAFTYGLAAVLLGATLDELDVSTGEAGLVLAAVVAGAVSASLMIGRYGDRWGRRQTYRGPYLLLAVSGMTFAFVEQWWALALVALGGALSTEVVESGPFTSIQQRCTEPTAATPTRITQVLTSGLGKHDGATRRGPSRHA